MKLSDGQIQAVLKAFENPKYKWRTISGVSEDTKLSPEQVREVISTHSDQIVKSSISSSEGQELFSTRKHLRQKASIAEKIFSVVKNRAD